MVDDMNKIQRVCVNMGQPILTPKNIPVNLPGENIIEQSIEILGQELLMTCVSMGNPHAVFFCDDVEPIKLEKLGPVIENHSLFPNRINVHFAQIDGPRELTMRTWERGSGITMACGTGACAVCVAGVLTDRQKRICTAHLPGGELNLNWCEEDGCVYMTGPAIEVFEGIWPE
jgi:diaminopimelate epimerase